MAQDYRELAMTLRGRIDAGEFRQTGKLPTEDQLIEEYQTTRYRVRNAIAVLADAGDVFPVRGQRRVRARGPSTKGGRRCPRSSCLTWAAHWSTTTTTCRTRP